MKDAVIGIVFADNDTKVLILERCDVPVWVMPSGGIDEGESPEQAVVREVQEETGLEVVVVRQVGVYTPTNRLTKMTYAYECRVIGGELKTGSETRSVLFSSIDKLPKNFFFLHKEWIDEALKRLPYVIQRENSSVTYTAVFRFFLQCPLVFLRFLITRLTRAD